MAELVSLREFARRKGWNPGYVHKLKVAGRLVMEGDKIAVEASERLLAETADPSRAHLARDAAAEQEPVAGSGASQASMGGAAPLSSNATFNRARTASQVFDAKLRELDYQQKVGKLVDVDEAMRRAFTVFRELRDAIMNLPAQIKDELFAEDTADALERRLSRELEHALQLDRAALVSDSDEDEDDDQLAA